ncbi:hypothetical protein V6Z12_A06G066200 [Gossypium hirsutum]
MIMFTKQRRKMGCQPLFIYSVHGNQKPTMFLNIVAVKERKEHHNTEKERQEKESKVVINAFVFLWLLKFATWKSWKLASLFIGKKITSVTNNVEVKKLKSGSPLSK